MVLLYAGKELPYTIYRKGEAPPKTEDEKTLNARVDEAVGRQTAKPGPNHPWRKPGAIAAGYVCVRCWSPMIARPSNSEGVSVVAKRSRQRRHPR